MSGQDGTGPRGEGPMTGHGRGVCVIPLSTEEQELGFLENQARLLTKDLEHVRTRIKQMKESRSRVSKE